MYNHPRLRRFRLGVVLRLNAKMLFLVTFAAGNNSTLAAQQIPPPDSQSKGEIVMISPFNPSYPPLARQANLRGDVELKLEIRKDGSLQSATIVSGPLMLAEVALDSAQRSHFECRRCEDAITVGLFTYSFQIAASPSWPCSETSGSGVTQLGNHMTVVDQPALVDPYFSYTRARSAKCLYLWPCGHLWGGEGYYFYPFRSAKCLGLWNCGHRLRESFATCQKLDRKLSY
jgi:Gram-negative bacterial TonB protein C-terminal